MTNLMMVSTCSTTVGHFDGHGGAPEQYRQHPLMRHVQGYSGSHWMPRLGNYSLHIAPLAARATGIQTTINKYNCKAGHFDGHVVMQWYVTARNAQWRRSRASLEATGCCHRVSIMPDNIVRTWLQWFF
jgi:hypothetical protein